VLPDGRGWRAGASDEWVTAYTGAALAGVPSRSPTSIDARQAADRAWALLRERRPAGTGWGFNRLSPPDADTTAWTLRLATALGAKDSPHLQRARQWLGDHVLSDGGLTTYRRDVLEAPGSAGWSRSSHACVSAAGAPVLGQTPVLEFLRREQLSDGSWSAYWWHDPEYATALAAAALAAVRLAADRARVAAATAWAAARMSSDGSAGGSPFATGLCLRILGLADDEEAVAARRRATAWLGNNQRADGSWAPSARLRVPPPHATDPAASAETVSTIDDKAVFTTATVIVALAEQMA
jgi:squalene cyclase